MTTPTDLPPSLWPYTVLATDGVTVLATVLNVEGGSYVIRLADGRVLGWPASATPTIAEATAAATSLLAGATPPAPVKTDAEIWADKLNGSILDATTGIALKANRSAKNDFVAMFTLLSGAISAGAITAATPQDIWDADNVQHTLPASDILALLLRYGFAWQQMFNQYAP